MEDRRKRAEENYRQKFEALGLNFTFLRREWSQERDRRFWIRCNRCGAEFLRYNDIFKGRVKSVICRNCGNGTSAGSEVAADALAFYAQGHSARETARKFGTSRTQVSTWARARGVSNGRTFEQGGHEENEKRAAEACIPGRKRYRVSHYARAKMRGLPAEEGITLKKLIDRDGLSCAICGLQCFYGGNYLAPLYPSIDHIKPISRGGGHTWDNVQIAHRYCNLIKGDGVGRRWHNGND